MSELKDILNALENAQASISTVIFCNPEQKEMLERASKGMNNVYLIENCHIKLNEALVVENLELKKMIISMHKAKQEINNGLE